MRKSFVLYALLGIAAAIGIAACSKGADGPVKISVDLDQAKLIEVPDNQILKLEANDSSMLYGIAHMEKIGNELFIQVGSQFKKFDATSGRYLGNISGKGNGPGEYNSISTMWAEGDTLFLQDPNNDRVLTFSPSGQLLGEIDIENLEGRKPLHFLKTPQGGYLGFNTFTDGTTPDNPMMTFYDSKLKRIADVPGREMLTGGYMSDRGFADPATGKMLIWEFLQDTVFSVSPKGVAAEYLVDFGSHTAPADIRNITGLFARMNAYDEVIDRYAMGIMMFQKDAEGNDYFMTTFNKNVYIVKYNPVNDKTQAYRIEGKGGEEICLGIFFKIIGDKVYVQLTNRDNPEENPYLAILPLSTFN